MNSSQFFDLLNETDSNYLAAAHKSMTEKPARAWFRPALIAACLTLVLLAIPVGIMIGKSNNTPQVPVIDPSTSDHTVTTVAPHTTEAPKTTARPSILDIPGATVFDENDGRFETINRDPYYSGPIYDLTGAQTIAWAKRIKKENDAVLGVVKDYTSVIVPDGKAFYRITTMEITVLEDYSGIGSETIKAVYTNRYELDSNVYRPVSQYFIGDVIEPLSETTIKDFSISNDMFQEALECTRKSKETNPCASLLLLKKSEGKTLTIDEKIYNLSDYANYVLDASFEYEPQFDFFFDPSQRIAFIFRSSLIREVFMNRLAIHDSMGYLFKFEESYNLFDNRIALSFSIPKFTDHKNYEVDSIFSEMLFMGSENPTKLTINPAYQWAVTIEGVKYDIARFNVDNREAYIKIYLDLGPDFSFNLFDYNENNQYTYENVRLDIYDREGNLFCYSPLTNIQRIPGGYTHTKLN
ncbi:MAG: hypothetical protein IKM34_03955 [Clostridia bacterium]|nr:hypothetical protein [Clostridia bacterium]